jgi:peptide/nickel transport system permease protein
MIYRPQRKQVRSDFQSGYRSPLLSIRHFARQLLRNSPLGACGGIAFLIFLFCGIFANFLAPSGANVADLSYRLEPPSFAFPFGTDHLGRDVFSRVLIGGQVSMIVAVFASTFATFVSLTIGVLGGYLGGRFDSITQRFVDAWMTFPDLVLLIAVISVIGTGMPQIILVLGLLYGVSGSRIIRGSVVSIKENLYISAAQAAGAGKFHIMWRHIIPNLMPVVIVLFTTRVGAVILAEAGLSFLGLGVPPPAPTWGGMLSGAGRTYMYLGPWLALAPGIALAVVVYSINVFGDALRDQLDPRMRGYK